MQPIYAADLDVAADIAIIHGCTRYNLLDGREGRGRYTDVWVRQRNSWKTISAHVTCA